MSKTHKSLAHVQDKMNKTSLGTVKYVDLTPDDELPIRILEAYRNDCNTRWETHGLKPNQSLLYDAMNEHQKQRAVILDKAISRLM